MKLSFYTEQQAIEKKKEINLRKQETKSNHKANKYAETDN
jgi:hypothetical protein